MAEGLVFGCIHPAPTHRIYSILVSKFVSSSHPDRLWSPLPGAGTRDPTHDKVRRRKPDKADQVFTDSERLPPALTLKMISVFLMLALIDYSLISVTQAEDLPRSLSK